LAFTSIATEQVELGRGHGLAAGGLLIRGELVSDERVLEDLVVLPHRAGGDAGVRGDGGVVDLLAVHQTRHVEEAAEAVDRPRQALGLDLLAQVGADVRLQVLTGEG
jgi:hypothetical protein